MGSSESKSSPPVAESKTETKTPKTETKTSKKPADDEGAENLSGIDLVNYKCRRKEKAYKKCVSNYYTDFLAGKTIDQEESCGELFQRYRRCYLKGVQIAVWGKDSPPPAKGSVLASFVEEEKEDD